MSSITFPHANNFGISSIHSNIGDEDGPYNPSFDTTHGIQMNPLSQHPPRTPRTSTAHSNGYDLSVPSPRHATASIDGEEEEERTHDHPAKTRIRNEEVWREIVKKSDGRDKAFKLIQYSMKLYLLCHATLRAKQSNLGPLEKSILRRFSSTVSSLSMTRRCLLLFNWLGPLTTILARQSVPYSSESTSNNAVKQKTRPFIHALIHTPPPVLLDLVSAIADDFYTCSRIGLVGRRVGDKAAKFADWCWLFSTIVNLVENAAERGLMKDLENQVEGRLYTESMTLGAATKSNPSANKSDETELGRLKKQDYWLVVTRNKLLLDLVFVSFDCFGVKRGKATVQTLTGLAAAYLSTRKLFAKEGSALAKTKF
ncbi:hypothetical protein BJ322DRAFT_1101703 [Thelephora terrestris]|uniref:Peroxisomal biogenesis factor 11 n=1 Tax=Thelephora terrestris TaxID=56493 RepID=A0A9P6L252_9AGAM|nr:hypothetical protein BJ322DRAFT_1101703 [Thelephora terrestris]